MNRAEITALAQRAQAGDRTAFETLYNEFSDRVYFFAKRNIGSSDAARDITSETFVTALERIGELRSGESFIGWLYSIAYSRCVKYNRDCSRTEHFEDSEQLENTVNDAALNEPVMLPEDYVSNAETREQLKAVINRLPPDQRSAVILYYYDEMSVPEVAKTLGTNEHNASQKLFTARKRIRRELEKLFGRGGMPAAVPLGAMLNNTVDRSYAHAAASGAARVAGRSLAVKLIGVGAAAAVAVGVPAALHNISEKSGGGDYRPEDISSVEAITEKAEQAVSYVTQNDHFRMTLELHEIKDGRLNYTVSLEGADDFGKDYIKNSQAVRDYIFYTETLNAKSMTESEYEAAAEAYRQEHKNEPYEALFPLMYTLDEKGERHYYSSGDNEYSETVCTSVCSVYCPADAESLTLHFLQLENDKGLDHLKAGIFEGMDMTFDLAGVTGK